MKKSLSSILKDICASMIVEDDTPSSKEEGGASPAPASGLEDLKPDTYVAPPKFKPKRRNKTKSEWDYRSTRTEYMQDYRSSGKDLETGNRYVKKYKGVSDAKSS